MATSTVLESGLELKLLDIGDDLKGNQMVADATRLTLDNWGEVYKFELGGNDDTRFEKVSAHLIARSKKFAEGQIVAYYKGKLVGIINANRMVINRWRDIPRSWKVATGNHFFNNYKDDGNVLVCPNVSANLDAEYRGLNIGRELILAVKRLAESEGIEGILPYSRFKEYKVTKDSVRAGKDLVVKLGDEYYVVGEDDISDPEMRANISKTAIPIKEFRAKSYIFFRRFNDLFKEGRDPLPYDPVMRFHSRLGAVPIGVRKKIFDAKILGIGFGGRPSDRGSSGHNPILLYDLTGKMFDKLVQNDYFRNAFDGMGRELYQYGSLVKPSR